MSPETKKPATETISGPYSVEQLGGGLDLIQPRSTVLRKPADSTETASTNAERQWRYPRRNAMRNDRNALTVKVVTNGDVTLLCAQQDKIEFAFNDDGEAFVTQLRWPDEHQTVIVSCDNIGTFSDNLTDSRGIPSFGRSG